MKKNVLLTISYDGTDFCGWQRQPGVRTVQGDLESALSKVCGEKITVSGTSRTDAGVHALGQRASFVTESGIPTEKIPLAVNNMLAGGKGSVGAIKIISAEEKPLEFHARFDSRGKKYRYIIRNNFDEDIFLRNYCYQIREPLDIELMRQGATHIVGTHDFACFQSAGGTPRETTVRTVHSLEILQGESGQIFIEISGDGFLYNMVRIITGTLVEVALGKIQPESVREIIAGGDRQAAGHTAPPQGLYLVEVFYD